MIRKENSASSLNNMLFGSSYPHFFLEISIHPVRLATLQKISSRLPREKKFKFHVRVYDNKKSNNTLQAADDRSYQEHLDQGGRDITTVGERHPLTDNTTATMSSFKQD